MVIEKLSNDALTEDEREAFEAAEYEYANGGSIDFDEYLLSREISVE